MNKAHLTAISRNKISAPMQYLEERGLIKGKALDYGCGKSFDASYFNMDKYDPYFNPVPLFPNTYDTVTCNYVLNVIKNQAEAKRALTVIRSVLKPKGKAYITVRRDKFTEGYSSKGTYQTYVHLDLPIVKETSNYCIYELNK